MTGIRLAGDRPIPPAPSFGVHRPVSHLGHHLGAIVEIRIASHVPVCAHPHCRTALDPRRTKNLAEGGLYRHWDTAHPGEAT